MAQGIILRKKKDELPTYEELNSVERNYTKRISVFGTDITSMFTDGSTSSFTDDDSTAMKQIKKGTFKNIFVGDWFTANYNGTSHRWVVVGINIYKDIVTDKNSIMVMPIKTLQNNAIGDSTRIGFAQAPFYTTLQQTTSGGIAYYLKQTFGDNLINGTEVVSSYGSNSTNDSIHTQATTKTNVYSMLLTPFELFGSKKTNESYTDMGSPTNASTNTTKILLPIFNINSGYLKSGFMFENGTSSQWATASNYWLMNLHHYSILIGEAYGVRNHGNFINTSGALATNYRWNNSIGIRPRLMIGG